MEKFKLKLITIFGILSLGIIGAYFIVSGVSSQVDIKSGNNSDLAQLQEGGGVFDQNISSNSENDSISGIDNAQNLTETFTQSFFNQVQAADISKQSPDDLKNIAGTMSQGVLTDVLKSSPQLKTVDDIKYSDLKISTGNITDSKKQYIKNISNVAQKDFSIMGDKNILEVINSVYGKNDYSTALKYADCYKNAAKDFLATEVPGEFVAFHKKAIVYYMNSEIVFRSMASYSSDLFRGSLALEMVDQLLSDADEVQSDFNEIAK